MKYKLASGCWTVIVALGLLGGLIWTQERDDYVRKLVAANNRLALSLHKYFTRSSSENVFFSPLSLFMNFGMLYVGARGETAQDLGRFLGYQETGMSDGDILSGLHDISSRVRDASKNYTLNVANAILVDNRLQVLPDFKEKVENVLNGIVHRVSSENRRQVIDDINNWANSMTNGKIPLLLRSLDPQTIISILSAVYFKGLWMTSFNPTQTKLKNFYSDGRKAAVRRVPMMFASGIHLSASDPRFHALELPYLGGDVAMLVLLPRQLNGLRTLEQNLTAEDISTLRNKLHRSPLDVRMPKFKLESTLDLKPVLRQMGLERLFHRGTDFSGMVMGHDTMVNGVKHKAVVEVNEKGTEAAAVTVTNIRKIALTPAFTVDHPFLFLIVDKRLGAILFMGRVNKLPTVLLEH